MQQWNHVDTSRCQAAKSRLLGVLNAERKAPVSADAAEMQIAVKLDCPEIRGTGGAPRDEVAGMPEEHHVCTRGDSRLVVGRCLQAVN